jgi:Right handed beta helix region
MRRATCRIPDRCAIRLNNERLVPGVELINNLIYNFGQSGIRFEGDTGAPTAAVPFGRIVNNTIYGRPTPTGVGISVANNASPTLLNNIVANTAVGILVDPTSSSTVVGTSVFQGNSNNGVTGTNAILLAPAAPLFVNGPAGNFYLAPGSLAIDSSINTLQDRASIVAVKSSIGIPQSPITAPGNDRFGQLRIDDPSVPNASGLGQNIFKDRGAIERADFLGPTARLVAPLDNGPGTDGNPAVGVVLIASPDPLTEISIELNDPGIGIDHDTVLATAFVLRQNNVVLVNGVDYIFSYNRNTRRASFLSVSVFPSALNYTITLNTSVIKDVAGNRLQGNQPDGTSLFTIIGNGRPNLTNIATFQGSKNGSRVFTYAELLAASDLSVFAGHTALFRVEAIVIGTLTITSNNVTSPVVPGVTIFAPGDTLTWTPPFGTQGLTGAFTVVGFDPQNALAAPLLSTSTPPVAVNVDLINIAPTLTTIAPLLGGIEDTAYEITYATLLAASNIADSNFDTPLSFRIENIPGGTLQISVNNGAPIPVVAGVTIFGPNDKLIWNPAPNINSVVAGGPVTAFTVVGSDGSLFSTPPVAVRVDVAATPDSPILTTVSTFGPGGINSAYRISFEDILAASDAQNVDGNAINFRIESIAPGATLVIRKLGQTSTAPVVPGTTLVSAGDVLYWTPPAGATGSALNAFTMVNFDSFNAVNHPGFEASTPAVQARVNVLNSPAPVLTAISVLTRPRFVPSTITYAELRAASNATLAGGNPLSFRIESITTGTLVITKSGTSTAVAVVPGVTLVSSGDVLTWTSVPGASGARDAFNVRAIDAVTGITSLDPVLVRVRLVNVAPTLTSINTLPGGLQQTPFNITYATLLAASNAADVNNDTIRFRIDSVATNGVLTITKNGTNTPAAVTPGTTFVAPGDRLTWTPNAGVSGSAVVAFSVKADDGSLLSATPVDVKVEVLAFGTSFNLTGPWTINNSFTRIQQTGPNLTFVNESGVGSSGTYIAYDRVSATGYGLTATIDTTTADNGRLLWSDGKIWLRLSLGGQWYNTANNQLTSIVQSDMSLTFVNEVGSASTGTFLSPSQVIAINWGNLIGSFADGKITFSNGVVWKKLNLATNYTDSVNGGTTTLVVVDPLGQRNNAHWINPTQITIPSLSRTGTVGNGRIVWSVGGTWNKSLQIQGTTSTASGPVSVTSTGTQLSVTNAVGQTSRLRYLNATTVLALDWGSLGGVISGSKIQWINGEVWSNFDFNAFDAVFSDVRTFPFGA